MIAEALVRRPAHVLLGSLCGGIALANGARCGWGVAAVATAFVCGGVAASGERRLLCLAVGLAAGGWWWGSLRLAALDESPLTAELGRAARSVVAVTAPARRGRFTIRAPAEVRRFDGRAVREPVLVELPRGRAPPQGAVIELVAQVVEPATSDDGFDEKTYLRRHGIHVVLRGSRWRAVGRRGGVGAVADHLHAAVDRTLRDGVGGERRALLLGVVLGDDGEIADGLRERFRASGLYHLLGVDIRGITT